MNKSELELKIDKIKSWLGTGSINIFGLPFAGKDTHGKELAKLFGGAFISGGSILRGAESPTHVQQHIAKGNLAPTDEYLRIVLPYFSRQEFNGKPLVLSSVGRWHGEEAGVLEATAESRHRLLVVLYLHITQDELRKRWLQAQHLGDRGEREDDAEHVLEKRLQEFEEKTIPVINFYRDQGMLIEVDGMSEKSVVSGNIIDQLYQRATQNH